MMETTAERKRVAAENFEFDYARVGCTEELIECGTIGLSGSFESKLTLHIRCGCGAFFEKSARWRSALRAHWRSAQCSERRATFARAAAGIVELPVELRFSLPEGGWTHAREDCTTIAAPFEVIESVLQTKDARSRALATMLQKLAAAKCCRDGHKPWHEGYYDALLSKESALCAEYGVELR